MSLTEEIKKILDSDIPKSRKNEELKKLGLRDTDINAIWFNKQASLPKQKKSPLEVVDIYKLPKRSYNTQEEWDAAEKDFNERYPNAPKPKVKEVLNLILRKEIAHEIVSGEKKIEIREVSPFYISRIWDKEVDAFLDEHPEIVGEFGLDFYDPLMVVEKIHFYSYSNTWNLDVECTFNTVMTVTKEEVKFLQDEYGCHEFDDILEDLEKHNIPDGERPQFFIFAIGKILDKKL